MDELSAEEARGAAVAANLRRAFGAPDAGPLPQGFASLLRRLGEVEAPLRSRASEVARPRA
jgi:hypothetical protein